MAKTLHNIIPMGAKTRRVGRPTMKLSLLGKWIAEKGWSRDLLAKKLGKIPRQSVDRLCRGDRRPGLVLALLIEKVTDGQVPVSSWAKVPAHGSD